MNLTEFPATLLTAGILTAKDKFHHATALPEILMALIGSSPYPLAQLDVLPETTSSLTTHPTQALPWCKTQQYPHVSCLLPLHRLFLTPYPFAPFHLGRPYFKCDFQSWLPQKELTSCLGVRSSSRDDYQSTYTLVVLGLTPP